MAAPRILVSWSDVDRCFIARIIGWPGVSAHGDTEDEARAELRVAFEAALALLAEHGLQPPRF